MSFINIYGCHLAFFTHFIKHNDIEFLMSENIKIQFNHVCILASSVAMRIRAAMLNVLTFFPISPRVITPDPPRYQYAFARDE